MNSLNIVFVMNLINKYYHGFRFADYLQPFVYGGVSARRMVSMGALGQLQHNMRNRGRAVGAAV